MERGWAKKLRGDDRHPSKDVSEADSYLFDFFFPFFLAAFFFLAMTPHLLSTWRSSAAEAIDTLRKMGAKEIVGVSRSLRAELLT